MGLVTVRDVNDVQYDIPDGSRIALQGLDIIGDGATDWNEPIQKNLVHLSNEQIKCKSELETSIGLKADKSYVDSELITKQNVLTAGTNITINNGVISADDLSVNWDEVAGKPAFFSGSYDDLTNKPIIPTVPTSVSSFTNDSGYLIASDISGKADISSVYDKISIDTKLADKSSTTHNHDGLYLRDTDFANANISALNI